MEIAVITVFLAIFLGIGFLAAILLIFILKRRKK